MKLSTWALVSAVAGLICSGTAHAEPLLRQPASVQPVSYDASYYAQTDDPVKSPSDKPAQKAPAQADAGCGCESSCGCDDACGKGCNDGCGCGCGLLSGMKISGWIEQGFTANDGSPVDRLNFGRLFDDRSNDYRFNQAIVTFEKALGEDKCEASSGFKLQLMYGSDARFIHYLGIMDNVTDETVQPDLVEAYWSYHAPILTDGGVDFKIGHFVTLHGAEVIAAPSNPLYSHSYMFNFGIPFKHTGVLTTTHLTDQLDIMAGVVGGINTGWDDNNDVLAFHGGAMWKSADEMITMVAAFHGGAENDSAYDAFGADSNHDMRNIFDLVTTVKVSENLTSITDINVGRDEAPLGLNGTQPEWYGVAQYFVYTLNECTKLVLRAEVFRDDDGFVVFKDPENDGFINAERGIIPNSLVFGGADTYTEVTLGITRQISDKLVVRPEIRWDWAQDTTPYNDATDDHQFTAGFDVIWTF